MSVARLLKFNFVGAIGIAVQLSALAAFVSSLGLDYRIATPLAVEAAVLHNFFWHERFTWADRRGGGRGSLARLLRFNLGNGAISLLGNSVLMPLLVGHARLHYIIASVLSITLCWAANFLVSDRWVFRGSAGRVCGPTP